MKQYNSVEELAQASSAAVEQYTKLMSGSAAILFLVAQQNKAEKQQEVMRSVAEKIGVPPVQRMSTQKTPAQVSLNEVSRGIYEKVQEYRQNSSVFVVEMFDEGLKFLENLCQKYI